MIGPATSGLLAGVVAGLGIAMPVGAIGTYLVALGAREPRRVATAAALGVASTDGSYALLAVAGGAALQSMLRPAATGLRWASVGVLVLLAVVTVSWGLRRFHDGTRGGDRPTARMSAIRAYLMLLGLTAVNPATMAYFTALVLGHQATSTSSTAARAAFVLGVFLASAAWQLTLVTGGAVLGHLVGGRRGQLAIAVVSGAVMLALAIQLGVS